MDTNYILKVYAYGYDVEYIAEDLDVSTEDILSFLREFKVASKVNKRFTQEFKDIIGQRYMTGVSDFRIDQELSVGSQTSRRILKSIGLWDENRKRDLNKVDDFIVINHNDFNTCPKCASEKIADLTDICKNSYCKDCGTEWYEDTCKGMTITKQVLFHELA